MDLFKSKVFGISILILAVAVIGLASVGTVVALTVTATTRSLVLRSEAVESDGDSVVTPRGFAKATSTIADSGTSYPGPDATASIFTGATVGITADEWVYELDVQEAAVASWGTTRAYAVKVYFDNVLQPPSVGATSTVFFNNSASSTSAIEGVKIRVSNNSTSTTPANVTVQVEVTTP